MVNIRIASRTSVVSRRHALGVAVAALVGLGCQACIARALDTTRSTNQPLDKAASLIAESAAADTSVSADSTVESNRAKRFADIPEEALLGVDELHSLISEGALDNASIRIVDIRSHRDYQKAQIEGSRNIPAGRQIEIRIDEIPRDKTVILIAYKNSDRLAETWYTLVDHGYDPDLLMVVNGGVNAWVQAGYPTLENQFLGC